MLTKKLPTYSHVLINNQIYCTSKSEEKIDRSITQMMVQSMRYMAVNHNDALVQWNETNLLRFSCRVKSKRMLDHSRLEYILIGAWTSTVSCVDRCLTTEHRGRAPWVASRGGPIRNTSRTTPVSIIWKTLAYRVCKRNESISVEWDRLWLVESEERRCEGQTAFIREERGQMINAFDSEVMHNSSLEECQRRCLSADV